MFHIQIILWLSQHPVHRPVLVFLRGWVGWLVSQAPSSVSPRVLCDTWRYSRIISTICGRATMKFLQMSNCFGRTNQIASMFLISVCEVTVKHKSSGKLTFCRKETFSNVILHHPVISILVQQGEEIVDLETINLLRQWHQDPVIICNLHFGSSITVVGEYRHL